MKNHCGGWNQNQIGYEFSCFITCLTRTPLVIQPEDCSKTADLFVFRFELIVTMAPIENANVPVEGTSNLVMAVDASRRNILNINANYKEFAKRVRNTWKVNVYNSDITFDKLKENKVFIIGGPRDKYTASECEALKKHVEDGRGLMVMLSEGGETRLGTNINFVLEQFGIAVNADSVIRTSYYKYFHPKEVLVANGILNRGISQAAGKMVAVEESVNNSSALSFLYPFGSSLNVVKPAIPVLSTGSVSLPLNQPVCALYENSNGGKLAVLGSCHMFHDNFIDKEENTKILDVLLDFLSTDRVRLDPIDSSDPEVADYTEVPDIAMLAEQPKACLHESDDIPADVTRLFDHTIFSVNTNLVPTVIKSYEELKVKHEQLTLISPQFETPLLPLEPAVSIFKSPFIQLIFFSIFISSK